MMAAVLPISAYEIHALENSLRIVVQNRLFFIFLVLCLYSTATSNTNAKEFRRVTMLYGKLPNN